jgi:hypothetical protein
MRTELTIDGARVTLEQHTDYPDELVVDLIVTSSPPRAFSLVLRMPGWATGAEVQVSAADGVGTAPGIDTEQAAERILLRGTWSAHRVRVAFTSAPTIEGDASGDGFVRWGPRVLGMPIPDRTVVTADYGIAGLVDVAVTPSSDEHADLHLVADPTSLQVVPGGVEARFRISGVQGTVVRRLTPLGTAALRRVTFPVAGTRAARCVGRPARWATTMQKGCPEGSARTNSGSSGSSVLSSNEQNARNQPECQGQGRQA